MIAAAIIGFKFGREKETLSKLVDLVYRKPFVLTYEGVQNWIAQAICRQKFGTDLEVLSKLLELICREPFVFTYDNAQRSIAQAIYEQKFGTDPEVLSKLADLVCRENGGFSLDRRKFIFDNWYEEAGKFKNENIYINLMKIIKKDQSTFDPDLKITKQILIDIFISNVGWDSSRKKFKPEFITFITDYHGD